MKNKERIIRLFVTAICLFCINLFALADETTLPANWENYGKLATFANGERNNNADIVLSTVDGRPTYTIYTARGLAWVACVVNNYYDKNKTPFNKDEEYYPSSCNFAYCNIQLANDISLAKPSEGVSDNFDANWIPIGEYYDRLPPTFSGNFDGKGHTISNLNVLRALEQEIKTAGLIGYANCGSIEDEFLSIKNLNVTGNSIKGLEMVGGIVGYGVNVQISCCSSQIDEISIDNTSGNTFLGGIAGSLANSKIKNCWSSGKVYCEAFSNGGSYGGGIVGNPIESTISDSYSTATVTATVAGGIAGYSGANTTINNCLALNTGGIVGYSDRGRIWARDNSDYPVTAADNYASVLVKLYTINTDNEKEEKTIYESEAYDGKKCTYKKLDALFGSNENFTFDGTYLPQLKGVSGQTQLAVNTYLGSKNITNSVGDKLIVLKAEIPDAEVEIVDNPNDWYKVTGVSLSGATLSNTDGRYTFTMPENDVTVSECTIVEMDTWEKYGMYAEKDTDYTISGTTYTINTARGLAWVAYVTNNGMTGDCYPASAGFEGCTVELGNDLSLAQPTGSPDGFASWTPIGTSAKPFLGTFDGKYKAISGLKVTGTECAGLFGYIGNSTSDRKGNISNIGINEANVTGSKYAGALVGCLYGTMERCWSSGSVTSGTSAEAAGGLVGEATDGSTISNCYSTASVTAPFAGGVVGSLNGKFEYCYATGKVTSAGTPSSGSGAAGGICGTLNTTTDAEIKNNFAFNKDGIEAQTNGNAVGRIIGVSNGSGSITYTDNYASVLIAGTWSETNIKTCTYDKLNLLSQDNTAFKCDTTYLPKLVDGSSNVMSGQEDLKILDYIGGGSITVTSSGNFNFSATKESAIFGDTVKFTVTPESEWYYIVSVKVNKVDGNGSLGDEVRLSQPSGTYSFTMPETPVKITVNIEAIDTWEEYAEGAVSGTDYIKDGTTYTIKTARGLAWVAYVTNKGRTSGSGDIYPESAGFGRHIINLANDISITKPAEAPDGWTTWTPIGTNEKPFLGTFDGNNHVVSDLKVSGFESAGLFGFVGKSTENKKGKISNLGVDGANVTGTTYAGVIAGQLYGTMEKCWSSGSVTATGSSGRTRAYSPISNGGGLVGEAISGSEIKYCYSTAEVSAYSAGGIVGIVDGTLQYCYATGKVTSTVTTDNGATLSGTAGGICGAVWDVANINNCIAMNADGITGNTTGRIWGEGSITVSSNYASTMISGDTWTSDAAGKDGEGVKYSGYISYVKNNWSQDVWTISNKNLPQLNGMSRQSTLPRETYMEVDVAYITITPPSYGRIEVYQDGAKLEPDSENKIEVANGSTVTIKAVANSGYGFSWLKINEVQQQGATVEDYEVNDDITLSASFYYIIPSVFMYDDVCYEKRWDARYWEEVMVRNFSYFYYNKYYTGDLEIPEKVPYYGTDYKVTAINDRAFSKSSELRSIVLPSAVNKIGSYAFEGCTGLEKLVVKSPSAVTRAATTEPVVPTVGEHAFDDICETAELYVPENWKEAFKAAPEWNKFYAVKEQREDGTVLAELTMTSTDGGSLSVDETTAENDTKTVKVAEGTDVTVEVTPREGYMLTNLSYDGVDVTDQLVDGKLTLSGISGEKCISAVFGIDTGIGGAGASSQNVYVKDGRIVVEGVAAGEEISIYNTEGKLLRREVANGELVEIPMTAGQMYIVKIGKKTIKI